MKFSKRLLTLHHGVEKWLWVVEDREEALLVVRGGDLVRMEGIQALQENCCNVRNICILAHVDHGNESVHNLLHVCMYVCTLQHNT